MEIDFTPVETPDLHREHIVVISKDADRQLSDSTSKKHIEACVAGVNTPAIVKRGWSVSTIPHSAYSVTDQHYNYNDANSGVYTYTAKLKVECNPDREYPNQDASFQNILNSLQAKLKWPGKWSIDTVDGRNYVVKSPQELREGVDGVAGNEDVGYIPIGMPDDFESYFDGLYGLEPHINRIKRALEGTMLTGWQRRLHCILLGEPACGKSEVAHRLRKVFGDESVLEFDATATTMAGAIEELKTREELPRILIVEEIEKADEKSLAWLLAFMDQRGEIRKRTARGKIEKDTKMICIATANDENKLKAIASGALYSRFSNKIYFNRPTRDVLGMILQREIDNVTRRGEKADSKWIIPTLELGDTLGTNDPRELQNLMLCGRDGLLDGTFQREMIATLPSAQAQHVTKGSPNAKAA